MRTFIFLFILTSSFATISGSIVWEFRTAGTANAGGGFKTGASGTDHSQQDAVQAARTDLVIGNPTTTELSSAADNFAADDVGNLINITAGTNFTIGRYEIVSVAGGVATVDRSVGTAAASIGSGTVGGAIDIPLDAIFESFEPGNIVYFKAGTYTLTSSLFVNKDGTTSNRIRLVGYNTTRGDDPTTTNRPLISAAANFVLLDNYWSIENMRFASSQIVAIEIDDYAFVYNTEIINLTAGRDSLWADNVRSIILFCDISAQANCLFTSQANVLIANNVFTGSASTTVGVKVFNTGGLIINNIFNDIKIGVDLGTSLARTVGNTFYSCTDGVLSSSGSLLNFFFGNIFSDGVDGIDSPSANSSTTLDYNVFFNNSGNDVTGVVKGINTSSLNPTFDDAPAGDFNVGSNMDALAGPALFSDGLTENLRDAGAAESTAAGGGGGGGGETSHTFG